MSRWYGDRRIGLKPGDWLRCTLPKLTKLYGCFCQIVEIPAADKGLRVAFPPTQEGWKPYRTALDDGHWEIPDPEDAVSRLGWLILVHEGTG